MKFKFRSSATAIVQSDLTAKFDRLDFLHLALAALGQGLSGSFDREFGQIYDQIEVLIGELCRAGSPDSTRFGGATTIIIQGPSTSSEELEEKGS